MDKTLELQAVRTADQPSDPDRFRGSKVYLSDDNSKQYFETWTVPTIEVTPQDSYHEVISGEEGLRGLTLLSYAYYRRVDLWWVIAVANNIYMPSRDMVPGLTLRIPSINAITPLI